jgi:hypothetical protein
MGVVINVENTSTVRVLFSTSSMTTVILKHNSAICCAINVEIAVETMMKRLPSTATPTKLTFLIKTRGTCTLVI